MKILIAGASGLIGNALIEYWKDEHDITALGRTLSKLEQQFSNSVQCVDWVALKNLDATQFDTVINLCGKNISEHRWTEGIKKDLIDSRIHTTKMLLDWMQNCQATPHFYCANAVGIYGLQENGDPNALDENTPVVQDTPKDFLQEIGIHWQQAAEKALEHNIPLTITRFGVVLKKGDGMLKKLAPSFYFGLGSVIGDGKQIISWIHIDDLVRAFDYLLQHQTSLQGPVNLCAPQPVSQREFARALASAMHRPLLLKTPAFVIRWLFGEMGECLINRGQCVIPRRLLDHGFEFQTPDIESALQKEFSK